MNSPQDQSEDFDEEYHFIDDEVGEAIANPISQSGRYPFAGAFKLGHWIWHAASVALMILAGTVFHDLAFLTSLACGIGLLALDSVIARVIGWAVWMSALAAMYYGLKLVHPADVPWWVMPSLIATIVLLADALYRLGRRRLGRRRTSPLDLSAH